MARTRIPGGSRGSEGKESLGSEPSCYGDPHLSPHRKNLKYHMPRGVYARVKRAPRPAPEPYQSVLVEAPVPVAQSRYRPTSVAVDSLMALKLRECMDLNRKVDTVKGYIVELRKLEPSARFVVRVSPDRENWTRVWRVE